ncbi:MAG: Uncharacterized protein CEN88_193, partial [Candidatus Berkelbacteria bacterium Licking1014_2]
VLAGPGSGKTQVLILRIAEILKKTQMNPYNILGLTFTESASEEMKERLINLIGPTGYDVNITTFHGFANSIIQEFPFLFGQTIAGEEGEFNLADWRPLDDLERLKIIEQLLTNQQWQYIQPLKNNLFYLREISRALSDIKRERLTGIMNYELRSKDKNINNNNVINRTKELFRLHELYQTELAKRFIYDYEDMLNWVIDKMKVDWELSLLYQERYQYILVDEYQDTNNSQLALLKILTSFYKDNPNLFVVGDPNQSIFRFQGASSQNIQEFIRQYPLAKIINLNQNYRSGRVIIDAAAAVINHNEQDFKEPLQTVRKYDGRITSIEYTNKEEEVGGVADRIKTIINRGGGAQEIAILVRKNNQINDFIRACEERNVPYQVNRGENILDQPFMERFLILLETINQPLDKIALGKTAYYFRNQIGLEQAALLAKRGRNDNQLDDKTEEFIQKIDRLAKQAPGLTIDQILEKTIEQFSLINEINEQPNRLIILDGLKTLFDNAKQFKSNNFDQWLKQLRDRQKHDLNLITKETIWGKNDGVAIQTYHQAKGEEYTTVFLPQMEERLWTKKKSDYFALGRLVNEKDSVSARPGFGRDELPSLDGIVTEERRLFYVGLTRAKRNCFISHEKTSLPSRFINELPEKIVGKKIIEETDRQKVKRLELSIQPLGLINISQQEKDWLRRQTEKLTLSPTGFNKYLNCPKDFLLNNILRIPMADDPGLIYGTAIHGALEKYYHQPELKIAKNRFQQLINQSTMSEDDKKRFLAAGGKLLTAYVDKKKMEFVRPAATEYTFSKSRLNDIPLGGKIDKIDWLDESQKTVRVIDYKTTGRAPSRNEIIGQTKKTTGSTLYYLNQLKFYWLLGQLDKKFASRWLIGETALEFLDNDHRFKTEVFSFSNKEINQFQDQIRAVWSDIQAFKFPHNPQSTSCRFCHLWDI